MLVQLLASGLALGAGYALVALGFTLVYSITRFFHFAHGAVYTVAAYMAFVLVQMLGLNALLGILIALALAAAMGMAINWILYEPLLKRDASPMALMVASLGTFTLIQNLLVLPFGSNTLVLRVGETGLLASRLEIAGAFVTGSQLLIVVTALALFALLLFFFTRTRVGLAVRAIGNDLEVAESLGMNPRLMRTVAFGVASVLAGAASILVAIDLTTISPNIGFAALLMATISMVVGGVDNVPASVVGGFLLGIVQSLGVWQFSASWQDAIAFTVLAAIIAFRPAGLFGRPVSRVGR